MLKYICKLRNEIFSDMKKKELKNLAKKIAEAEYIIQNSDDSKAVAKAQNVIIELSGKAMSLEDMMIIDDNQQNFSKNRKIMLDIFRSPC